MRVHMRGTGQCTTTHMEFLVEERFAHETHYWSARDFKNCNSDAGRDATLESQSLSVCV